MYYVIRLIDKFILEEKTMDGKLALAKLRQCIHKLIHGNDDNT